MSEQTFKYSLSQKLLRLLIFEYKQDTSGFPGSPFKVMIFKIDQGLILVPSHKFATSWRLALELHIHFFVVLFQ